MSTNSDHLTARIFLRPIGIPLPLGMTGLAIASLVTTGVELHWVSSSQTLEVGVILAVVPFTLQLIACVLSYLARDGPTGATLGVMAVTWLALGLIHVASPTSEVSGALGLLVLVAGAAIALSALVVGIAKPLPALVFLAAALRFELVGVAQLSSSSSWQHASGILGLVVTGLALYSELAFELEAQTGKAVLPTFRRATAASAVHNGAAAQLTRIEQEPGVRQTT